MPTNYTGSSAGITARQNVTISEPAGTDVRNSASVRTPLETLANVAQYLMQKVGLIDVVSTWTAKQTMSGGVGGLPEPSVDADAATKLYADGRVTPFIATLIAGARTWAAMQTFSAGVTSLNGAEVSAGSITLSQGAGQQVVKTGAGVLQVGTAGNTSVEFMQNSLARWKIDSAGDLSAVDANHRIKGVYDPTDAQDAATKGYVDGRTAVRVLRATSLTISDANTHAVWSGWTEPDTNYRVVATPVYATGAPALGSKRIETAFKATNNVDLYVEAAPGAGSSVTFDVVLFR